MRRLVHSVKFIDNLQTVRSCPLKTYKIKKGATADSEKCALSVQTVHIIFVNSLYVNQPNT